MDEIRNQCARLLSEDSDIYNDAYDWLNRCEPFRRVLERFHENDITLFEVADLLRPGSTNPLSDAAVWMLQDELRQSRVCINAN